MNTETKISFLQFSQQIASLNNSLLELMGKVEAEISGEPHEELMNAAKHLMQAQNNIMKAVK